MKTTIISLIFKSPKYADFVWSQAHKYTEELKNGKADFLFVANHATPEVIEHLKAKGYPFVEYDVKRPQPNYPANMSYIYKAHNYGANMAKGEYVCFIASDLAFSPYWLTNLLKWKTNKNVMVSRLVECGRFVDEKNRPSSGEHAIVRNFGMTPETYDEEAFQIFVQSVSDARIVKGGLFCPILWSKEQFLGLGGYTEQGYVNGVPGDRDMRNRMEKRGIETWTAFDSIVYHTQSGEFYDG